MLFRVDASTKLALTCGIEGRHDGRPVAAESRFDSPENGPADIDALGVPRKARVVDRVPSDNIRRILDTLQAGRERMGPHRAVFVINYPIDRIDRIYVDFAADLPDSLFEPQKPGRVN